MDEEETNTVFRDMALSVMAALLFVVILMLPFVNPRGKNAETETAMPGTMLVEIRWPDALDVDIDLWVQAPGDIPVGYSNLNGSVFNLLRDDLGKMYDLLDLNYETSYTRGLPAGEYAVNVYYYRGAVFPVPVTVQVSVKRTDSGSAQKIFERVVELKALTQELTVTRFAIGFDGHPVPDSEHAVFKPLASSTKERRGP